MKQKLALLSLSAFLAAPAFAAPESYTIDPRHTFPMYEVNHLGFSTQRGRFNTTSGKITIDREAKRGTVQVTIDTSSVSSGVPKLDEHLRGEDFFDVAQHPSMTFKSSNLKFNGDVPVAAEGELTIRGITKPVTLAITSFKCGPNPVAKKDACGADANVTIKRSDFGMKYALPALGDDVKLLINVEAFKD
ncbi:MAG TPA: YceI family protein [Burkholderiales bacterium]|nr:polyisoprenoid-binding protein [Betaproteobacteria bacterium]HQR53563.1 YceI family protein [Burkholderiales bacterium]